MNNLSNLKNYKDIQIYGWQSKNEKGNLKYFSSFFQFSKYNFNFHI